MDVINTGVYQLFRKGMGGAGDGSIDFDKTSGKAYFQFEEASGDLINQALAVNGWDDGLESAANGQNTSVIYEATGIINNGYDYDAASDKTVLGTSKSQFNFMHNTSALMSVNLWYKQSSELTGSFVSDGGYSTGIVGVACGENTTNRLTFSVTNGLSVGNVIASASTNNYIPDTNWHMYTWTYDYGLGSNNLKQYRDGANLEQFGLGSEAASNADSIQIMHISNDGVGNGNLGIKDEISIWNRILTLDELTSLYNGGAALNLNA